jgi:hypothetical protein
MESMGGFVFLFQKQRTKEQSEKPRGAKALLGFFLFLRSICIFAANNSGHEFLRGDIRERRHQIMS